jgi:hypothetical protein
VLNAGVLTFAEFATNEPLPLSTIHQAVLEFLRGRDDLVVSGATAVNAYVSEPRMTQDIDLISTNAPELVDELREYLGERFHIAMCVRVIGFEQGVSFVSNTRNWASASSRCASRGVPAAIRDS